VCAELRRRPETRRTQVVMLTARDDEDNVTRAFAAGADDYITKPVRRYELLPRLGAHLRSKRLLDELEEQTRDRNLLLELSNTLASRFDIRQILRVVAQRLIESIHVDRCSIILFEENSEFGVLAAASEDPNVQDIRIPLKAYPEILEVIQTRAPLVAPDAGAHPLFSNVKETLASKAVRASILFPMSVTNEIVGVLLLRSNKPIEALSTRELMFGQTVAAATAIAVRNARMFGSIAEESVQLDVERREVSEKLETVRRFEDFVAGAADGMLIFDDKQHVTYANKRATEILHLHEGQDFLELIAQPHRTTVKSMLASPETYKQQGSFDIDVRIGERKLVLSASVSSFLQEHSAALLTFRDVTRDRANESELQETKDFLENLINASVDPIVAWSPDDGHVMVFSRSAQRLFGYPKDDTLNLTKLFGEQGAADLMRELRAPERGGHGRLEMSRRDVIARTGERIPVNLTGATVFEREREVAVVAVVSDLRERLRIEGKLSLAQEKLQMSEKQAVIAELAGTTAHELNQPLTSVMGYAELLARKVPEDSPLRRPVNVILKEAERMAEIVRKIGRITKYETKTYVGSTRIVDLEKAVDEDSIIVIPPPRAKS